MERTKAGRASDGYTAVRRRWGRTFFVALVAAATLLVTVQLATPPTASAAVTCAKGSALDVVAHPDDDLLFQSATIRADIDAGKCVRTVYVTSGDDGLPSWYWQSRESGVQAAYAQMAGVANRWSTSDASVPGHPIVLKTLRSAPEISLVFLRLPDGQMDGSGSADNNYESLQKLYQHVIGTIHAIDGSTSYTEASL
ncbi:MAG TPA: PIG-L family deacetylase, partial [Microbacteriaceae bacterium]|nr:PIG-L family deacetylase [Microbacteriaceae bacterium]